jgi:hypothetical protein
MKHWLEFLLHGVIFSFISEICWKYIHRWSKKQVSHLTPAPQLPANFPDSGWHLERWFQMTPWKFISLGCFMNYYISRYARTHSGLSSFSFDYSSSQKKKKKSQSPFSTGNRTGVLMLNKQVLFHLSHASVILLSSLFFSHRISHFCSGQSHTLILVSPLPE